MEQEMVGRDEASQWTGVSSVVSRRALACPGASGRVWTPRVPGVGVLFFGHGGYERAWWSERSLVDMVKGTRDEWK
jgi:hypothetical protein